MAKITGARELRAALKLLPADLRKEAGEEVRASTKRMRDHAHRLFDSAGSIAALWHGKPGMQNITGKARRNYRMSVSRDGLTGRVGLLTSAAMYNAPELYWFIYGTSHQPARNVHDIAFEAERDPFILNQGDALARILTRMG